MKPETQFAAPWSMAVKVLTVIVVLLMAGIAVIEWTALPSHVPPIVRLCATAAPLALLFGALPFMVRGYILRDDTLVIRRLGWTNHFDLHPLVSVAADPGAMAKSIRLFGCGGLFGFFGIFRNRNLGTFRAYGTDPHRSVVLKFPKRTIVVTPDNPERFVAEMQPLLTPRTAV